MSNNNKNNKNSRPSLPKTSGSKSRSSTTNGSLSFGHRPKQGLHKPTRIEPTSGLRQNTSSKFND